MLSEHVRHSGVGQQCAQCACCVTGCLQFCHDRETGTESGGGLCNKGLKKRTMQAMCTKKVPTLGTEVRADTSKVENCMEPAPVLGLRRDSRVYEGGACQVLSLSRHERESVLASLVLAELLLAQVTDAMHWGGNSEAASCAKGERQICVRAVHCMHCCPNCELR